jgi:hypothetical protein
LFPASKLSARINAMGRSFESSSLVASTVLGGTGRAAGVAARGFCSTIGPELASGAVTAGCFRTGAAGVCGTETGYKAAVGAGTWTDGCAVA